ncbi:unnamed protein product, partial [Mesorhabditis belari]|uniref:Large ribosomal subunit protein mL53 n=1 Tax=Mesorhabditis belari TaxID=2138241 RepID=A0AAF3F0B5_9BILA
MCQMWQRIRYGVRWVPRERFALACRGLNLAKVKTVDITFDPFHPSTRAIRSFWEAISAPKIKMTNPSLRVKADIRNDQSSPFFVATLDDGKRLRFETENMHPVDLIMRFNRLLGNPELGLFQKGSVIPIDGYCKEGYAQIKDSFRKNFEERWEAEGSSFAVYKDGELIVDIWGGYAEKKYGRFWKEETLSTIFSISKSFAAICFAMQVDRGACSYQDLVTKYWPEYGKNGKETTTIEQLLAHQSGVPCLSKELKLDELTDAQKMDAIVEAETSRFPPGSKTAYQPFTHGWMADGLFRRIDKRQRSIAQFYNEEIRDRYDIDVYIGGTQLEEFRIARLKPFTTAGLLRECGYSRGVAKMGIACIKPSSFFAQGLANMKKFGKDFTMFNNPELRILGQTAVNGIGTARGLAKAHQVFLEGNLIGKELMEKISTPMFPYEFDETLGENLSKGFGWMYWKGPMGSWQFGHTGVGGQNVRIDPENGLVRR